MTGEDLKTARLVSSWTQHKAAQRLGVTQAYLSMVERGARAASAELMAKVLDVYDVQPLAVPLGEFEPGVRTEKYFKEALGTLKYPGFTDLANGMK
jgi:transcriptional regulator with XRE-family HTH domain